MAERLIAIRRKTYVLTNYMVYGVDLDKLSQHSWGSGCGGSGNEEDVVFCTTRNGLGSLKRHNSLKVIRQRDLDVSAKEWYIYI